MTGGDVFLRQRDAILDHAERTLRRVGADAEDKLRATLGRPGPSSEGEAPARDSGQLVSTLNHRVDPQGNTISLTVGVGTEYARILEDGSNPQIGKRPFMEPSMQAAGKAFEQGMKGALQ